MSSKCSKAEILSDVGTENRKRYGEAGHVAVNEKTPSLERRFSVLEWVNPFNIKPESFRNYDEIV